MSGNFKDFVNQLPEAETIDGDYFLYIRTPAGNFKSRAKKFSIASPTNDIGEPGTLGFGVGVYPDQLPTDTVALPGTFVKGSQWGNYQIVTDGSIMVWVPACYMKVTHAIISGMIGDGTNVTVTTVTDHNFVKVGEKVYIAGATGFALPAGQYVISAIISATQFKITSSFNTGSYTGSSAAIYISTQVKSTRHYATEAEANLDGFFLHRAFIDGGVTKKGVWVDKYDWSLTNYVDGSSGIASSIALGNPISSHSDTLRAAGNPAHAGSFSNCKSNGQTPTNDYAGAFAAAKSRGNDYAIISAFVYNLLGMLSIAHAQASTSTAYNAWYHASNNWIKGNNNYGADVDDATCTFTACSDSYWSARNEARKTGSGGAKTAHNGQECGIYDLNGNQWKVISGLTNGDYFSKNITGITKAAECVVTIATHGYTTGQQIEIAGTAVVDNGNTTAAQWNTALQYKFYEVEVVDVNSFKLKANGAYVSTAAGLTDNYVSGFVTLTQNLYVLKEAVALKTLTGGTSSATDAYTPTGAASANFKALYEPLSMVWGEGAYAFRFGSALFEVFRGSTAHDNTWKKLCAGIQHAKNSVDTTGSSRFVGKDYNYSWMLVTQQPIAGGNWRSTSSAGVFSRVWSGSRANADGVVSGRSCRY